MCMWFFVLFAVFDFEKNISRALNMWDESREKIWINIVLVTMFKLQDTNMGILEYRNHVFIIIKTKF